MKEWASCTQKDKTKGLEQINEAARRDISEGAFSGVGALFIVKVLVGHK